MRFHPRMRVLFMGMAALGLAMAGCNSGSSSKKTVIVTVPEPLTIVTPTVLAGGQVGAFYFDFVQASGGIAPHIWVEDPGTPTALASIGLSIDPAGAIVGTPSTTGNHSISLLITDSAIPANSMIGNFSIDVTPSTPLIITTSSPLPNANVGVPYSEFITTTGGVGTLTFSVSSGSLPMGLNINASGGLIFGSPSTIGLSTFDVTVMDAQTPVPNSDTATFDLTVDPGVVSDHLLVNEIFTGGGDFLEILNPLAVPQDMTGWSVQIYYLGQVLDRFFLPSFTLPAGEALGLIEGTGIDSIVSAPYFVFTIWNNPAGFGDEQEVILRDNTGTPVDYVAINPGGTATHLPSNLNWSGEITQTGDFSTGVFFDDVARTSTVDSDTASDFAVLAGSGTLARPNPGQAPDIINILVTVIRDGYEGFNYNHRFSAIGGLSPYSWSANPVDLPPGTTLDPITGVLSGVATTAGSYTFTIDVSDVQPAPATASLSVTIVILGGVTIGSPFDIKINEVGTGADYVELINTNTGTGAVDIGGWNARFFEDNTVTFGVLPWIAHFTLPEGLVLPAGQTLLLTELSVGWLGPWELGTGLLNILWNAGAEPGGCGLVDRGFNGIDYMNWGMPPNPLLPPNTFWTGSLSAGGVDSDFERSLTSGDTDTPADWCAQAPGTGTPGAPNNCP
ncbi:MAG: putative Ig domain-containing protein [Planctomycetota bacterium]|nr:putative Ig domain-containing protein [Planctomycetota bacterium]